MLISCMLHFSVPRARPVNLSFKLAAIVFNTGLFCTVFFKVYAPFFSTLWSSFQGRKRSYRFDVDGLSTRKWHIDVWENQHFSLNGMNCSWSITNLYVWIFFLSAVLLFAEKQPQMFFFLPDNVEKAGFVFHIYFFFILTEGPLQCIIWFNLMNKCFFSSYFYSIISFTLLSLIFTHWFIYFMTVEIK